MELDGDLLQWLLGVFRQHGGHVHDGGSISLQLVHMIYDDGVLCAHGMEHELYNVRWKIKSFIFEQIQQNKGVALKIKIFFIVNFYNKNMEAIEIFLYLYSLSMFIKKNGLWK